MRCTYCESVITEYPGNGLCPNCGGRLPPRPAGKQCPHCGSFSTGSFCAVCGCALNGNPPPRSAPQTPAQNIHIHIPQGPLISGVNCCPKCHSANIQLTKRGYRWGFGIFWGILIPVVGLLLGFRKSRQPYGKCLACGHKWKRI